MQRHCMILQIENVQKSARSKKYNQFKTNHLSKKNIVLFLKSKK
jgi:hypothetical protein